MKVGSRTSTADMTSRWMIHAGKIRQLFERFSFEWEIIGKQNFCHWTVRSMLPTNGIGAVEVLHIQPLPSECPQEPRKIFGLDNKVRARTRLKDVEEVD